MRYLLKAIRQHMQFPFKVTSDHSFLKLLQFAFGFPRAGKREGLSNAQKRACHDAWLKDKLEGVRLRCNHVSFPDLIPLSR